MYHYETAALHPVWDRLWVEIGRLRAKPEVERIYDLDKHLEMLEHLHHSIRSAPAGI
jgi:hypothetical protein